MKRMAAALFCAGAFLLAGAARADVFVTAVTNSAAFGNGPIESWSLDLTTGTATKIGSFVPQGAIPGGGNGALPNGRGLAVTNTEFYYTELSGNGFGPTLQIEAGPYNAGAGGSNNGSIANPVPGTGISALEFAPSVSGGNLYALVGYDTAQGPFVYAFDPGTGAIVLGPVAVATDPNASGFTILPNGNYLVSRGNALNSYDQYDPLTGARIAGTNISAQGCSTATGVTTDGTHLFFNCNFSSIAETDLNGALINNFALPGTFGGLEDLSLVASTSPGTPSAAVPEPGSILLLGTGAALVALKLRRNTGRSAETAKS